MLVALPAAMALAGCNIAAYFLHLIAPPEPTRWEDAAYDGLRGKTVAIVIYAHRDVLQAYPRVRQDLSLVVADELKARVEDIRIVPPDKVCAYQRDNLHWASEERTVLGRTLGGDAVLFISLVEYSTATPGAMGLLYRGRIVAEASVYDCAKPERDARVWRSEDIRVAHPEGSPGGQPADDDRQIAYWTRRKFADALVKKFYRHKVPKEPGERGTS
jgi:hypothetical protein